MKSFEPFDAVSIMTKFILNGTEYLPFLGSLQPYCLLGIEYKSRAVTLQITVGFSYICCPHLLFLCLYFLGGVFLFVLLVMLYKG